LSGKTFWGDFDEHDRDVEGSVVSSRVAPVMGKFTTGQDHPRRAILTGSNPEIPSPFPRFRNRKKASSQSSSVCFNFILGGMDVNSSKNIVGSVTWPFTFSTTFFVGVYVFFSTARIIFGRPTIPNTAGSPSS
jgi:hypothetical protein